MNGDVKNSTKDRWTNFKFCKTEKYSDMNGALNFHSTKMITYYRDWIVYYIVYSTAYLIL